jgi:hypothetical protein
MIMGSVGLEQQQSHDQECGRVLGGARYSAVARRDRPWRKVRRL